MSSDSTTRLIVFGASGGLGQHVWKAAVAAGHDTVAFVRTPSKLDDTAPGFEQLTVAVGDVMDAEAIRRASAGCSIAINCTSPAGGNSTLELARSIVPNAAAAGVERFYMVGGLGALWAPGTGKTVLVQDWDDADALPRYGLRADVPRDLIRNMTKGHLASMAYMASEGRSHSFVCPGAMYEGPATEGRTVVLDELGGQSAARVSFGDVAQVIVDDLRHGALMGHRVCVVPS